MLRLNARTKILMVASLSLFALLFNQVWLLSIFTIIAILLFFYGKKQSSMKQSSTDFKSIFILLVTLSFFQIVFRPSGALLWHLGPIRITMEGIQYGIAASLRLLIIFLSAGFLLSISYYEYLIAFQSWKLPYELSFLMASVLQFLPILKTEFRLLGEALLLRGIELRKLPVRKRIQAYSELVFPILGRSISSLKFRVISLEMRGFRLHNKRSSLHTDYLKMIDYVVQIGLLIMILLLTYIALT